ncbi:hypothetical protein BJ138DRAFT_1143685 [Hygrophoropsis aurantiaca]|uniref:Uncharacterized protein n=1 Tax=Hygrophoropsis aurantiaca TaxID=72124 RepID=A0ACB8AM63_9AGAM|nr:hypothetical protein BJ138DRAFT_1143685 [Hygrophoropsis aurantiaca]
MSESTPQHIALMGWSLAALLLSLWSSYLVMRSGETRSLDFNNYSWIEDDYPEYYPMTFDTASLVPEDTVHYPINGVDAADQWASQFPPNSRGRVCLGPDNRVFTLTMYDELHCLGRIREALADDSDAMEELTSPVVQRCFNFIRAMILCHADLTLEPVLDEEGLALDLMRTHTCKDWGQVRDEAERNWDRCVSDTASV